MGTQRNHPRPTASKEVTDYPEDEAALLSRLRAGDRAAFAYLVEVHSPHVYRVALKLLGDEQEAEEVLQETFLNAFEKIGQFEGRARLGTWLYRIATNLALMRLRKRRPLTVPLDEPFEGGDGGEMPRELLDWSRLPEEELLSAEARAEMDAAIAALPETLRSVFVLRDIEGLSIRETADVLGLSVPAVKSRLLRARLALRKRLSDYFAERVRQVDHA
ncbi:MAG: sigma-70 family RNA polymerase sigma factor [Chloroflexi bacterium]|nr:MAG: sigma-70 family RNA polymerase sigma factor [Chloroflexota bacterium]